MIKKILRLFGLYSVKSLNKKSDSIVNVFNKTTSSLANVNQDIKEEMDKTTLELLTLEQKKKELFNQHDKNSRLIIKINKFLDE